MIHEGAAGPLRQFLPQPLTQNLHDFRENPFDGFGRIRKVATQAAPTPTTDHQTDPPMKNKYTTTNRCVLKALGAFSLASVLLAGAANAATTVPQTVNFDYAASQSLSFEKFNPAFGTLTGVSLSWNVNSKISTFNVTNIIAETVTLDTVDFTRTFRAYTPSSSAVNALRVVSNVVAAEQVAPYAELAQNETYYISNLAFDTLVTTNFITSTSDPDGAFPPYTGFNDFIGTGTVPLYLTSSYGDSIQISGSGGDPSKYSIEKLGNTSGDLTVTYHYEVTAVPEPSTVLLCAAPVLLCGATLVRRARKSRKPVA